MSERLLTPEPLHVDPALAGAALASPARRFAAIFVDAAILLVPTLLVAVGASAAALRVQHPAAFHAMRILASSPPAEAAARRPAVRQAIADLAPLLAKVRAPGMPAAAVAALEEGDTGKAVDLLETYDFSFALNLEEEPPEREVGPRRILVPLHEFIPSPVRVVALLGVPALYFVLFTRGRRGATPGKRLLGIRVTRLDGERLSFLEALERFVGYVHIPATLFLGLSDLWRDPNRRLAHDRTVHTAVFRSRKARAVARDAASRVR